MKTILPILYLATLSTAILVPPPTGPYEVSMKVQPVTDPSRTADPFDANDRTKGRQVLFSIFLPVDKRGRAKACPPTSVPYMTPKIAAYYGQQAAQAGLSDKLYSSFDMEFCNLAKLNPCGSQGRQKKKFPVALFTPGLGDSRLLYGAGARSLASQGYVVITVDHPYEAEFVEFPDGTVIAGRDISADDEPLKTQAMTVRTADLSYIVDQLHNQTFTKSLLGNYPGSLDLNKLVVYAHSVGGGAAAMLVRSDKRVLGGIDFDGQITEPIRSQGLNKPFLLAGRYGHSAPNSSDPTWNEFWPHLTGPRMELAINGSEHGSYTDRPLLVSALGLPDSVLGQVAGLIGSVRGRRLEKIVNSVMMSFFDFVFYKNARELEGLPRVYSEVSITRGNL